MKPVPLKLFDDRRFIIGSLFFLVVTMLAVYLSAELRIAGVFEFGLDDFWIHATFARNFSEGKGFSFNPSEPVSGSTAPLYTLMLSVWYKITGDVIWGAKLIGMLFFALTSFLIYRAVKLLTNENFIAWFASALSIVSIAFLFSALNGMETICYIAIAAAVLYFFAQQKFLWMIAFAALGVWLRPEGVVLLGIVWLMAVPKNKKIVTILIGLGIVLPYFYFNYSLSDYVVPQTVIAKQTVGGAFFSPKFLYNSLYQVGRGLHFFALFLFLPFGVIYFWRRARWIVIFPLVFYIFFWATSATIGNHGRYLFPLILYLYVFCAAGGLYLWTARPAQKNIIVAAMCGILLLTGVKTVFASELHGLTVQNIHAMQVNLAKLIPEFTQPSDTIATNDIGAIGYFGNRYVLDLVGLVSPIKPFNDNLRDSRPAMLAIFDIWFPERTQSIEFISNYTELAKITLDQNVACADSVMTLYARNDRYEDLAAKLKEASEMNAEPTGSRK